MLSEQSIKGDRLSLWHLPTGKQVRNIGRQTWQKLFQDIGAAINNKGPQLFGLQQEVKPGLGGLGQACTATKGISANEELQEGGMPFGFIHARETGGSVAIHHLKLVAKLMGDGDRGRVTIEKVAGQGIIYNN
jgi:hypothetical protein